MFLTDLRPTRTALALNGNTYNFNFKHPILIDKNTAIIIVNQNGTALVKTTATIYGFLDEVN